MNDHVREPGISPATFLQDWLRENGFGVDVIAGAAGPPEHYGAISFLIREVLDGKPLTAEHARVLRHGTFIPESIWLALEAGYRAALGA